MRYTSQTGRQSRPSWIGESKKTLPRPRREIQRQQQRSSSQDDLGHWTDTLLQDATAALRCTLELVGKSWDALEGDSPEGSPNQRRTRSWTDLAAGRQETTTSAGTHATEWQGLPPSRNEGTKESENGRVGQDQAAEGPAPGRGRRS